MDFSKSKNIKKRIHVSNAGQMGKRIMESFTKYIREKVGLGPGQKLTDSKMTAVLNIVWK